MAKECDYESLAQDAADLYLLRKNNQQIESDSTRIKVFIAVSICALFSLILFLIY